jgi:PKD repeat protein
MRISLWTIVGALTMCGAIGCTRSEEPPAASATPAPAAVAATPAAAGSPAAAAEADDGDEILMVWAEAEPEEGKPPLTVQLKADISGGKGERKVKWDFGDGSPTSSEVNPTHTYDKAGTYRASVEVGDSTGDSDSDYVDIEIAGE